MGGQGYLQVNESRISVANVDAAYEALESAVTNRTYNFGELRLDKNNKLEIINNHKNTFIFHRNNTVTSAEENRRVREAAFAILDARFGSGADADTLALVKTFLCGDEIIAEQPLTRDEVANMIKLLKGMPRGADKTIEFLRTSYGVKHGLLDTQANSTLGAFTRAGENRISKNIMRSNLEFQKAQKAAFLGKFMNPPDGRPLNDGQILKNVFRFALTSPSATPLTRLIASLLDPSTLEKVDNVKDYFMKAAVKCTRDLIGEKPGGRDFLLIMSRQYRSNILAKLGGDKEVIQSRLCGDSGSANSRMQKLAFEGMAKDGKWWQQFAADCVRNNPGFGKRLKGDIANLVAPPDADPEPRKAFSSIADTFALKGDQDNRFQHVWEAGIKKVLSAYRYSGGDLAKTRAALADLRTMVDDSIKAVDREKQQLAPGSREALRLVKRESVRSDANTLVGFLEGLLKGENVGHAKQFLNYLAFGSQLEDSMPERIEQVESAMIESWMSRRSDGLIAESLKKHFETDVGQKLQQLKASRDGNNADGAKRALDGLIDECATQVEDFAKSMFGKLAFWGDYTGGRSPLYVAVDEGASTLVDEYRRRSDDELVTASDLGKYPNEDQLALKKRLADERRAQFADVRHVFFGRQKEADLQKMRQQESDRIAQAVSSYGETSTTRLKGFYELFKKLEKDKAMPEMREMHVRHEKLEVELDNAIDRTRNKEDILGTQQAIIDELKQIPQQGENKVDIGDTLELIMNATCAGGETDDVDSILGHIRIAPSYVFGAFTGKGIEEKNAQILSDVYDHCQKAFGMSKAEVGMFVDPAAVAIIAGKFGDNITRHLSYVHNDGNHDQRISQPGGQMLDMVMQCVIAKAKSVYEKSSGDKPAQNAAQTLLWKIASAVTAAGNMLGPLDEFAADRGLKSLTADCRKQVEQDITQRKKHVEDKQKEDLAPNSDPFSKINQLLGERLGKLEIRGQLKSGAMTEYKSVSGKENGEGIQDFSKWKEVTSKGKTNVGLDQTSQKFDRRADEATLFWNRTRSFLWSLDRLVATLEKCGVCRRSSDASKVLTVGIPKPTNLDSASRAFVEKVKGRFGGKAIFSEKKKVDENRFRQLVGTFGGSHGSVRRDFSMSFNFN